MSDPKTCPTCGSALPADATGGACPKCLLQAGFATGGDPPAGEHVPTPEELAPKFPGLVIEEMLGRGGMGVVYRARHRALDREVALKILPERVAADRAFADRFQREARALAKLQHPNIVAVYDFGQSVQDGGGGLFWLVMEYVDGTNIRQAMRAGQVGPKEALAIVPQICDALQYAHEHGVVHRDIKPENVMLDKSGRVKVADFGLAKLMEQGAADATLTGAGQVMGTVHYMAPEQWEHPKDVDHRADIYSLGVVFYEMLTGELPLGRFDPPSAKVQIDVRLDEVVLRSLEKAPERRYQQASQIRTRMSVIADGPAPERIASPSGETTTAPPTHSLIADMGPLDMPQREKWVSLALIVAGTFWWLIKDCEPAYLMVPLTGVALLGLSLWRTLRSADHKRRMSRLLFSAAVSIGMLVVLAFTLETQIMRFAAAALGVVCAGLFAVGVWQLRESSRGKVAGPSRHVSPLVWVAVAGAGLLFVCGLAGALFLFAGATVKPQEGVEQAARRLAAEREAAAANARASARDFEAFNSAGGVASISADDRERIAELWRRVQQLPATATPDVVEDLYPWPERAVLADGLETGRATEQPLPHGNSYGSTGAEVRRKGHDGDLGLPFMAADRLPAPLSDFRLVRVSFEPGGRSMGAVAVVTNGAFDVWFGFRRDFVGQPQAGAIGPWYFDPGPVIVATHANADPASPAVAGTMRLLDWLRRMHPSSDLNRYGDLYPADAMKTLWAMPADERQTKAVQGTLGLPLFPETSLSGDALRQFRVESVAAAADGASANVTLTHVTRGYHLGFGIVRDDVGNWRFTLAPVQLY